jgi:4-hydroxy-4-methyl-2-oxoglutarate aldolase
MGGKEHSMAPVAGIAAEAMAVLKEASTGMVNDALALAGLRGSVVGIRPARGFEDTKIIGPAATVFLAPPHPDTPPASMYGVIREQAQGTVLVIDGNGWDANFTGDNNGECARRQGMAGIVVNGGARDVAGFRAIGFPLFCTSAETRTEPFQITGVNVPIEVGGVTIRPGDIIVADEDGVVAIPASALPAVLERLQTIFEVERGMEAALKRDAPVPEITAILAKKKPKK